jgi:hypothetical protein
MEEFTGVGRPTQLRKFRRALLKAVANEQSGGRYFNWKGVAPERMFKGLLPEQPHDRLRKTIHRVLIRLDVHR